MPVEDAQGWLHMSFQSDASWRKAGSLSNVFERGANVGWSALVVYARFCPGNAAAYHHVPADRPHGAQDRADFAECRTILSISSSSGSG